MFVVTISQIEARSSVGLQINNRSGISFEFDIPMFLSSSSRRIVGLVDDMGDIDITNFKTSHVSSLPKLNGDEIAEVLQSEAGFTISTDKKPIVATYGCGPCVALGGYDATNGIAFVVHFSTANEVRKCGGMIFYNISKLAKKKMESPIQLHIRGGVEGKSEETINAIKTWMKQREDLPMEIASEDVLGSRMCNDAKSISIDSRNGTVSDYNPRANLKSRGMSDLEAMSAIMSGFMPNIKIAYTPK